MSIELIVFESPEEEEQTKEEAEIVDEKLFVKGFSPLVLKELREMEFQKHETFINSDIVNIMYSQVIKYTFPHLTLFNFNKKERELNLKQKLYSVKLTAPERLCVLAQAKIEGKQNKIHMFVSKGDDIDVCAAEISINPRNLPATCFRYIEPRFKGVTSFKNDKQVIEFSKNVWEIADPYNSMCRMGIMYFFTCSFKIPEPQKGVAFKKKEEITDVEKILQFTNNLVFAKQYDLFLANRNMYDFYAKIKFFGPKSAEAAEIRDLIKITRENELLQNKQKIQLWHRRIISIVKEKISKSKFKKTYSLLNTKEKKQVDDGIKKFLVNEITEGEKMVSELAAKMESGDDVSPILKKLLTYTGTTEKSIENCEKMLKDNICPHTLFLGIANSGKSRNLVTHIEKTHKKVIELYGIAELLGETSCKICGEILEDNKGLEYSIFSRNMSVQPEALDKLYNSIWEDLINIISRYTVIEKSYKIQMSKIINNSAAVIRNELGQVQSNLMKNKTVSSYNFEKIIGVYRYIYIFALITQLIFMNEAEIQFAPITATSYGKIKKGAAEKGDIRTKIEKKIEKGKSRLQEIMNTALTFLRILKGAEIESSDFLTLDQLKGMFSAAYKWVYSLNYMNMINSTASKNWKDYDSQFLQYFEAYGDENVLGRTKEEILKEIEKKSIYETLQMPKGVKGFEKESLEATHFYLTKKVYRETVVPLSQIQKQYREMEIKGLKRDEKIQEDNCIKYYKITSKIPWIKRSRFLEIPATPEKRCRCRSRVYIFEKKGKTREYSNEEVNKLLKERKIADLKELYSMNYSHEKCIGCKNQNLLDSPIESSFWDYFTNACPEGDFHEYNEKECKKCKMNKNILEDKDKKFYQKYKKIYEKKLEQSTAEIYEYLKEMANPIKKIKDSEIKIQVSDKHIQQLSKEHGISYNFFMNIGLIKNQPFEKIIKGQINLFSESTPEQLRNRNDKLIGYIAEIFATYNQIKYSEYSIELPEHVEKILEKVNNKNFHKIIPDIDSCVIRDYEIIKKTHPPKDVSIYLLDELARFIIKLCKLPKNINTPLVKYFTSYLMSTEKMYAEYKVKGIEKGEANQTDYDTQGLDAEDTSDAEADIQDENELENTIKDEIDYDPLSTDKLDMEIDEDIDMDENLLSHASEG